MYLTYENIQWTKYGDRIVQCVRPPITVPDGMIEETFKPTKLVRVSDMKVVPGNKVRERYCAVSYSWNQSGDIEFNPITKNFESVERNKHALLIHDISKKKNTDTIYNNEDYYLDNGSDQEENYESLRKSILQEKLNDDDIERYIINEVIETRNKKQDSIDKGTEHNNGCNKIPNIINHKNLIKRPPTKCPASFKKVIQQICQDFNIKYVWLDQWCINQNDEAEKQLEIHRIHWIYSNAYCTVALVPEFCLFSNKQDEDDGFDTTINYFDNAVSKIATSQYSGRLWTLEEAIESKRLLFVGQNVHLWVDEKSTYTGNKYISLLAQPSHQWGVRDILYFAHMRQCTRDYDRVFAIANLFPDIMKQLPDSNSSVSNQELMIYFYRLLAEKDIGILIFGKHYDYHTKIRRILEAEAEGLNSISYDKSNVDKKNKSDNIDDLESQITGKYKIPMEKYSFLPSWTGAYGEHFLFNFSDSKITTSFQNYKVTGTMIEVTCVGTPNIHIPDCTPATHDDYFVIAFKDIPKIPNKNNHCWVLGIDIHLPGQGHRKTVDFDKAFTGAFENNECLFSKQLWFLSKFMKVDAKNLRWFDQNREKYSCIYFSLTNETSASVKESVILSGMHFEEINYKNLDSNRVYHYPVIRKKSMLDQHYEAIGTFTVVSDSSFFTTNNNVFSEQKYCIE